MMWKVKQKVDHRPQKRTVKVFALFPRKLYYYGSYYWVWLQCFYQDEYIWKDSYHIESSYPIIGNNNTHQIV